MSLSDDELRQIADDKLGIFLEPKTKRGQILTAIINAAYKIVDNES
jgi:hypothetical protein